MPPSTSNLNGALLLEEPLIRTPYELLRRSHRSAQRQVEKDFTAVQAALQSILKNTNSGGSSSMEVREGIAAKLDQAGERVRGLKRKLEDLQPSETSPTPLRSRLEYLYRMTRADCEGDGSITPTASEPTPESDKTLDRFVVDYLLRTGRMGTAKALAEKQGLENLVDIKLFTELIRIEQALTEKQSCTEALAWCGENRGTLKKTQNNLEFTLRLQEFIELCRKRDTAGAIAYSRKNLAGWAVTHMTELQQGMTLLAFGETTGVALYRKLYDRSRWLIVRDQFRETFLNLYALPSQSLLALSLSAGLSSLRLPSCVHYDNSTTTSEPTKLTGTGYGSGTTITSNGNMIPLLPAAPPLHNLEAALSPISHHLHLTAPIGGNEASPNTDLQKHPELPVGNVDCPTCSEDLKVLAKEVPMSHHTNSTIVCRISGEVMDSQNEPMAFPNGYVYSSKALMEMAKNNFDVVTCPRTRESCSFSRLRKVYIS